MAQILLWNPTHTIPSKFRVNMEAKIDDIVDSVRHLRIAEQLSENSTSSPSVSIQDALQDFIQSTGTTTSHSQPVKSLVDDAISPKPLRITEVCLLRDQAQKLRDVISSLERTADTLSNAVERSVIGNISSLGSGGPGLSCPSFNCSSVPTLLSHFDNKIRDIVRECLDGTSDTNLLWKVAEKCYIQATNPSGTLHADKYFIPLEEARLEEPFDPDFESEEYYDHENRLAVNEAYAAVYRENEKRQSEVRCKNRQSWVDF
jgi:hypothetical protein